MKICPKCSTEHHKHGTFCSRKCANSRTFSDESKKKRGETYSLWYKSLTEKEKEEYNSKKTTKEVRQKRKENLERKYENTPFAELPYSRKKSKVLKEQNNQCLTCGLSEWLNNPIKFELDHIDGNTENNIRTNLRVLCPNCHSQTPTFRKGFKNKSPSEDDIIEAYNSSTSMTEILSKLGLKWGSFVLVVKVLEKNGYVVIK